MVLFEIHQRFKGYFFNELPVSFKILSLNFECIGLNASNKIKITIKLLLSTVKINQLQSNLFYTLNLYSIPRTFPVQS